MNFSKGERPQRVLIVGWGFIGAAVGRRLKSDGLTVRILTPNLPNDVEDLGCFEICEGRAETEAFASALPGVDHVIYCAGGWAPPKAESSPMEDASKSIIPAIAMLETLKSNPRVGLTYLSSGGTIYGNPSRVPVPETEPANPISAYGISRLAGELYVRKYAAATPALYQVVRCANAYGPGQPVDRGQGAIAVFLHRVQNKLPITIYGDGANVRDYIHVDDVADAIAKLVTNQVNVRVVNVGSGTGHSVREVLAAICRLTGTPAVVDPQPSRPSDVESIVLDIGLLRSLIDFHPRSLESGLTSLLDGQIMSNGLVSDVA